MSDTDTTDADADERPYLPDDHEEDDGSDEAEAADLTDLETVVERVPEREHGDWWRLDDDELRVPADHDGPVAECPYCERPFATSRARALHVGEAHTDRCTEEERAAYREADEAEVDDLFVYHMKAVITIGLTWAAFVLLYMVAIGSNIV